LFITNFVAMIAATEDQNEKINQNKPSMSPLEDLAKQVTDNSTKISIFLQDSGHRQPSFDRDAPTTFIPAKSPPEIRTARQHLLEASLKIFQLAVGPSEYIPNLALGVRCGNLKTFSY
jgi:6-hydroxytryprostatin B O-methyltransferase